MKLCYRGAFYEYNPPNIDIEKGVIASKYRSVIWRSQHLQTIVIPQSIITLKYRGIVHLKYRGIVHLIYSTE